ncbi:MAG: phosphatase PAP2 family protein [Solirubrobacteraceae bacterium]
MTTGSHADADAGADVDADGGWLAEVQRLDAAVYLAVARTPTPRLDAGLRRLSNAANYSRLSLASAAVLASVGGDRGRRAAASGLATVGMTSAFVNLLVKPMGRRRRPERDTHEHGRVRHVSMPTSASFPSGHTAAAFAFASAVGRVLPVGGIPLRALAALVGYSRVHTGVHYPGDVIAGALIGAVTADVSADTVDGAISRIATRLSSRSSSRRSRARRRRRRPGRRAQVSGSSRSR